MFAMFNSGKNLKANYYYQVLLQNVSKKFQKDLARILAKETTVCPD